MQKLLLFLCVFSFLTLSAENLMMVESANLEIEDGQYVLTVSGEASTPGWKVSISPDWSTGEVKVNGVGPDGFVAQVITPYSITYKFADAHGLPQIWVVGRNQKLAVDVPALVPMALMQVEDVSIDLLKEGVYSVKISGQAPTPNYKIKVEENSSTGELIVKGQAPGGMVMQMITPYSVTVEYKASKDQNVLAVVGVNKRHTLSLPKPKPAPVLQSAVAVVEMLINAEDHKSIRVKRGELFIVWVYVPKGYDFAKDLKGSADYLCLGYFANNLGIGYICQMSPSTNMRSFQVVAKGKDDKGNEVTAEAQIMVSR